MTSAVISYGKDAAEMKQKEATSGRLFPASAEFLPAECSALLLESCRFPSLNSSLKSRNI